MDELLFTPASLLSLLSQIDELKDTYIGVTETIDGQLQLQVGPSIYMIANEEVNDVSVDDSVVKQIDDINNSAYEALEASGDIDLEDPVESGILKEIAKTLLVGGLVRLGSKLLR